MPVKTVILSIAALLCFAAAWRFGSHGLRLDDKMCVGLASVAVIIGLALLWLAFRKRPKLQ